MANVGLQALEGDLQQPPRQAAALMDRLLLWQVRKNHDDDDLFVFFFSSEISSTTSPGCRWQELCRAQAGGELLSRPPFPPIEFFLQQIIQLQAPTGALYFSKRHRRSQIDTSGAAEILSVPRPHCLCKIHCCTLFLGCEVQ